MERVITQLVLTNNQVVYGTAPYYQRNHEEWMRGYWERDGVITVVKYPSSQVVRTFYPWSRVENITFVEIDDNGKVNESV